MKVNVLENYENMSEAVAKYIIDYVNNKPESLLCLAGGDTPLLTYQFLVEAAEKGEVDFSKCKFVSLDEWVGLGEDIKGSCVETLYRTIYGKLPIVKDQVCFFNGLAESLEEECKRVDKFIFENNRVDIMLLGIGMNGHLGFNEPNVDTDLYCTVIPLDPVTKTVGAKYFDQEVSITSGITLGIKHIMESNSIILMANSLKKADIVKATVEGEISVKVPSSLVREVNNSQIFLDKEAASKLKDSVKFGM